MHVYTCIYTWTPEEEEEDQDKEEAFEEEGSCAWMFTLVCADMAAILFKALVGLEAEEEDACTLSLRRQTNTRAHSSLFWAASAQRWCYPTGRCALTDRQSFFDCQ